MAQDFFSQAAAAASGGDLETLKHLLTSSPEVLTARDSEGRTLLDFACRAATGDIAIPLNPGTPEQHAAVDLILKAGADASAFDYDNWSPLHTAAMHLAAQYNCVGCLNLLLDGGADPAVVDGAYHGTPKEWAEFHGSADAVEILNRRVG